MPFRQPTTTYEEARRASKAVRGRIQPRGDTPTASEPQANTDNDASVAMRLDPVVATDDRVVTQIAMDTTAPSPSAAETTARPSVQVSTTTGRPATAHRQDAKPVGRAKRKAMLSLSIPFPVPGVSASFDAIAGHHDGNTAMKTLLKRAMPPFEELLRNGRLAGTPEDYPMGADATDTTRMMDEELVQAARQHFDPFGVLSMRALARKIACAALATLFAEERSR